MSGLGCSLQLAGQGRHCMMLGKNQVNCLRVDEVISASAFS
jgi:hypothetical protein